VPYDDLIEKHASRVGIDPNWMRRIMHIESGGRSYEVTGSYKGLFQLSDKEFKRHGGSGSIYDPEQNTMAAANKMAQDKVAFRAKYGRDPTLGQLYMVHQQGEGGAAAHAANPDAPAWKNMLSTAEGRQKGEAWAKRAIWGNIPDNLKGKFGSVENVKSSDLTGIYDDKLEGRGMVTGAQWKGHMKALKKEGKTGTEPELQGRAVTQGEPEAESKDKITPYHDDTRVVAPSVEAPSVSMGRPVVAPQLAKATRVPQ
jgi:hypothetical protein